MITNKYLKYNNGKMNGGVKRIREFITWNVSWECMNGPNKKCLPCTKTGPGNITMCQDNMIYAVKNLSHRPHFFAIQEGNTKIATRIINTLNKKYTHYWSKIVYRSSSKVTAILIYDSSRFKILNTFEGNCDNDNGRPFIGGIFQEKSVSNSDGSHPIMTVVSVHGPHVSKKDYTSSDRTNGKKPILQQIIDKFCKSSNIKEKDNIKRTIFFSNPCFIMGDFNVQFGSSFLSEPFNYLKPVNNKVNSCCSFPQSNYKNNSILDKRKKKIDNILFRMNRNGGEGKRVVLKEYGTFKNIKSTKNTYPGYNFPDNNNGAFRYSRWISDHLPIASRFIIS